MGIEYVVRPKNQVQNCLDFKSFNSKSILIMPEKQLQKQQLRVLNLRLNFQLLC